MGIRSRHHRFQYEVMVVHDLDHSLRKRIAHKQEICNPICEQMKKRMEKQRLVCFCNPSHRLWQTYKCR